MNGAAIAILLLFTFAGLLWFRAEWPGMDGEG